MKRGVSENPSDWRAGSLCQSGSLDVETYLWTLAKTPAKVEVIEEKLQDFIAAGLLAPEKNASCWRRSST